MIRWTTAGEIRRNGGTVTHEPEISLQSNAVNRQHVHVIEGGEVSQFAAVEPNPVPKRARFGGPEYREPSYLIEE
jgi:hypothetical protein